MKEIKYITIKSPSMEVTFSNLGASIYSIRFNDEYMNKVVPRSKFIQPNVYEGKTIGRVAGRVKSSLINGYKVSSNEGSTSLHGGREGLSTRIFDYQLISNKIIFSYLSPSNESGYPSNLEVVITYTLEESSLLLEFEARVDKETPINLTNHLYFNLGSKLDDITLKMKSSRYIEIDPLNKLPLKEKDVIDIYDFNLGKRLSARYDNPFKLDDKNIVIFNDKYILNITTNYSWANIYTGDNLSIAIEPQDNQLEIKNLGFNELYSRFIHYQFSKR